MQTGLDSGLMHRVAVIGAGTLESYRDIVMTTIVGPIISLVAFIGLGSF
jgi:hypothetical protein